MLICACAAQTRYDFWSHGFTQCATEIERLFESVARSCMGPNTAGGSGSAALTGAASNHSSGSGMGLVLTETDAENVPST